VSIEEGRVSVEEGRASVEDRTAEPSVVPGVFEDDWLVEAELAPSTEGQLSPLYEAAAAGVLSLPFCEQCRQALELEQTVCDRCGGTAQTWEPVTPTGVVHSATMVHRIEKGLIRVRDPYPVVDVELASGHRLVLTTTGPLASLPRIGDPVTVAFRRVGAVSLPAVLTTTSSLEQPEVRP
jgi:uncharacterized protein